MIDDVVIDDVILCPHCGNVIGRQRDFTHLYMPNDLRCPYCGKIAMYTNTPKFVV
jgi:uncharacterized C2H2 Zn-finger protein